TAILQNPCHLWLISRLAFAAGVEKLDQNQPRDEATDVRRIRNAACLRTTAKHTEAANQLETEPDSNRHVCGNVGQKAEEDHRNASLWIQQYVTTQHARYRA